MCGSVSLAADTASDADRAFVAKVSQGGLYEVQAGRIAAMRGATPVVQNFGVLDAHDHAGVNSQLTMKVSLPRKPKKVRLPTDGLLQIKIERLGWPALGDLE
jgi:predicted outer membrane protein